MLKVVVLPIVIYATLCTMTMAAQSPVEKAAEAKQAAAEEAEARANNPEAVYAEYSGKLTLFNKEQKEDYGEDSGVVGTFATEKATYFVKFETDNLLKDLTPLNGKMCMVKGKIRNEGKYIIIQKVVQNSTEYIYKKRRGGVGM